MNPFRNKLLGLLTVFLVISCIFPPDGMAANKKELYEKLNHVQTLIEQKEWSKAFAQAKSLNTLYKKEKWKLQLLGDEREYEELEEHLAELVAVVGEKDSTQSLMILAMIRSTLDLIYRM